MPRLGKSTVAIAQLDSDFAGIAGEFGLSVIGRRVLHLASTGSTMDDTGAQALRGAPDGLVVISERQLSGRGRHGRAWHSQPGEDLLLSILLRNERIPRQEMLMLVSTAVARAVDAITQAHAAIKWPNDILIRGRKVCGVLAESFTTAQGEVAVAGIGLNVNSNPARIDELAGIAISLRDVNDSPLDRRTVLGRLLAELDRLYSAAEGGSSIFDEWKSRLSTIGEEVEVFTGWSLGASSTLRGRAEAVDDSGRLLVRDAAGVLHAFAEGEVSLRPRGAYSPIADD